MPSREAEMGEDGVWTGQPQKKCLNRENQKSIPVKGVGMGGN